MSKLKKLFENHSLHIISSFRIKKKKNESKKSKILKYCAIILFPSLAISSGVYLGIKEYNKSHFKARDEVIVNSNNSIKRKIFLVSNDNYTIPLTIELEKRTTLQQEILDVFDLLKTSSKANSKYVNGFINENTLINNLDLENKILTLDLSKEFLETNYNNVNVIEAFTLTFLQFDEIDDVVIKVDGEVLKNYNSMPLNEKLNYSFGINQEVTSLKNIIGKEKVVVFAKREYDVKTSYLIPITRYVDSYESKNITFSKALSKSFDPSTKLKKVDIYQGIEKNQEVNDEFVLSVNSKSLTEENLVNKDLYDLINLSLTYMNVEKKVSFVLNGESLKVDSLIEEESYKVSSIIINELKI